MGIKRVIAAACALAIVLSATTACRTQPPSPRSAEPAEETNGDVSAPEERTYLDLAYATRSSRQKLDLYLPEEGEGPFPVIVFVHGGGYVSGSEADMPPGLVQAAGARGYAVASVGYRLLDEGRFPAQVHDVKAALRWLRAERERYALDGDRIAIWGFSAGAHLATLVGTSGGVQPLEGGSLGNAEQSSRVQAVVDWAGPADFFAMQKYAEARRREGGGVYRDELVYLNDESRTDPDLVRSADPSSHADAGDPPILIQHGTADTIVPVSQATELARALRRAMGEEKVTLRLERDAVHLDEAIIGQDNVERTLDWLESAMPPR